MQIDTLLPYAKSYADITFSLILHHIQINVMPIHAAAEKNFITSKVLQVVTK
jgi:hypothetical protein